MKKSLLYTTLIITSFAAIVNADVDAEQPVKIQSDAANFDHVKGMALYTGNVVVDQGSRHLSADRVTIRRDNNNRIKIITANGNPATFQSQESPNKPLGKGKAQVIKYYPQQDLVDLFERAELTQDGDTITGSKISYNFSTGNLKTKSSNKERATVILQPKRES